MGESDPLTEAVEAAQQDLGITGEEILEAAEETPQETSEEPEPADSTEETEEIPEDPAEGLPVAGDSSEDEEPVEEPEDGDEPESEDTDADESSDEDAPLPDDAEVTIDGETVSGRELKDGYLRQADYTRKTQELAQAKREVKQTYNQMAEWYEERASNPDEWVAEIAQETGDVGNTLAGAIASAGDPNKAFGQVVRTLVQDGHLSDNVVSALGLNDLASEAVEQQEQDKVAELEERLNKKEQEEQEQQKRQQILQHYNQQWEQIKADEGLDLGNQEEFDAKVALMRFAASNGIADLQVAWDALARRRSRQTAQNGGQQSQETSQAEDDGQESAEEQAKETVESEKQKTSAMSRNAGGGPAPTPKSDQDLDAVVGEAMEELGFA